ncbi:hypothetical protein KCP70_18995 [Salmonella enterica subsp. enterica]|nr:hypothetical protein KCP70_18995 [Salmonella enterica subsp. enterica]
MADNWRIPFFSAAFTPAEIKTTAKKGCKLIYLISPVWVNKRNSQKQLLGLARDGIMAMSGILASDGAFHYRYSSTEVFWVMSK